MGTWGGNEAAPASDIIVLIPGKILHVNWKCDTDGRYLTGSRGGICASEAAAHNNAQAICKKTRRGAMRRVWCTVNGTLLYNICTCIICSFFATIIIISDYSSSLSKPWHTERNLLTNSLLVHESKLILCPIDRFPGYNARTMLEANIHRMRRFHDSYPSDMLSTEVATVV